jgi:catechol 2,3-dioxygenase-like lactoylglutathione lyase family enzyme
MNVEPKFAFVLYYVDDIEAARRFYVETLGLTVQRQHPTFLQFENFAIASDEAVGGTREPEAYWVVPSADAAFAELSGRVEVAVPLRELPFGKVFAVKDPVGNLLYLLEWAQRRPSQAA